MALKLGLPTRVSAESGEVNDETYPAWATITYEFPARGDLPPVKLTWYEGARDGKRHLPPPDLFQGKNPSDSGSLLVGEKGSIFSPSDYGSEQVVLRRRRIEARTAPGKARPAAESQSRRGPQGRVGPRDPRERPQDRLVELRLRRHADRDDAAGQRRRPLGKPIEYDAATGRVTNEPDAARFVRPEFRKGWNL